MTRRCAGRTGRCRSRGAVAAWASLGLSLLAACSGLPSATPAPRATAVSAIPTWIAAGDLIGVEVLILRDDTTLLHDAWGWRDRESSTPLRTNSVYSLASLTKPVTALAVLMLVDEGALSLDERVARHLPDFQGDTRATVRDLLAHTSGDGGQHGDVGRNVYDFPTLAAWVDDWAATEATGTWGEFRYSNFNYAALGRIVESVSGVELGAFVSRRILRPLGMDDSRVAFAPDSSWAERMPTSYEWSEATGRYEVQWTPDRPQRWAFFPAAFGLFGSARDYARFVRFWLDLGVTAEGRRLVSERLMRDALEPHGFAGDEPVYGYGWFVDPERTDDALPVGFRHGGGDGTLALAYPADRGIVVYLSQSERPPDHVGAFHNRVAMSDLFNHPGPYMTWARDSNVQPVPPAAGRRADYVGTYRGRWLDDDGSWTAEVRQAGGVLELQMGQTASSLREVVHLVPLGDGVFTYGRYRDGVLVGVDAPTRVRFTREGGRVVGVEVSWDGEAEWRASRVGAG